MIKTRLSLSVLGIKFCVVRWPIIAALMIMRDFRLEDHPISRVGTHLMWDAGGAVGDDDYSALDLAASFLALTPR